MAAVNIDGLAFAFPSHWQVLKYDDCAFHRQQFQSFAGGSKAVDVVALVADVLWLIEVKDYRQARREKAMGLAAEVAHKVRSTLAGLAVARVRANDEGEKQFAELAMQARQIRVALHLEQTCKPSRLFPQVANPLSLKMELKTALRAVDPHSLLVSSHSQGRAPEWSAG